MRNVWVSLNFLIYFYWIFSHSISNVILFLLKVINFSLDLIGLHIEDIVVVVGFVHNIQMEFMFLPAVNDIKH